MINKTPSPELLRKYLANDCNDSERQFVDEWYSSLQLKSTEEFTGDDEERLLLRIRDQISDQEETEEPVTPQRTVNWWAYLSGVAAFLAISAGFIYYNLPESTRPVSSVTPKEAFVKMVNLQKKVIRYELPDNSIVWIQPGGSIGHRSSFAGQPVREVSFEGEGFFNVSKDSGHPFIIHSGQLKTEVVGTSFNVRANRDESTYQVSVVSGSVAVSSGSQAGKVLLKPSQQAVFVPATNDLTMTTLEARKTKNEAWQPVSLTFDDVPLQEITERLQKTFKVRISINNPRLKHCVIKVGFEQQNLPEILEMINMLLGSTYEIEGDHITLSGEGCGGE
jgi:transmembrane sensor